MTTSVTTTSATATRARKTVVVVARAVTCTTSAPPKPRVVIGTDRVVCSPARVSAAQRNFAVLAQLELDRTHEALELLFDYAAAATGVAPVGAPGYEGALAKCYLE